MLEQLYFGNISPTEEDIDKKSKVYQLSAIAEKQSNKFLTTLSEEQKNLVTNLDKLMELEYIWSLATLDETDSTLPAGAYGTYTLAYNETKDAFITDSFYHFITCHLSSPLNYYLDFKGNTI